MVCPRWHGGGGADWGAHGGKFAGHETRFESLLNTPSGRLLDTRMQCNEGGPHGQQGTQHKSTLNPPAVALGMVLLSEDG